MARFQPKTKTPYRRRSGLPVPGPRASRDPRRGQHLQARLPPRRFIHRVQVHARPPDGRGLLHSYSRCADVPSGREVTRKSTTTPPRPGAEKARQDGEKERQRQAVFSLIMWHVRTNVERRHTLNRHSLGMRQTHHASKSFSHFCQY